MRIVCGCMDADLKPTHSSEFTIDSVELFNEPLHGELLRVHRVHARAPLRMQT